MVQPECHSSLGRRSQGHRGADGIDSDADGAARSSPARAAMDHIGVPVAEGAVISQLVVFRPSA